MSDDFEKDEARLQALFDATADEPTGLGLTRLRARAAEIPARAKRPVWRSLWVWLPGVAVGAGALALSVGTTTGEVGSGSLPPRPSALVVASPSGGARVVSAPAPAAESAQDDAELESLDGTGADGLGSSSELGVAVLGGAPSDADLDAWLYATAELLDNGG
ncbi:MAG: hypothetical protein OZ921_21510 [Sorangiineae bacterium]|nr:hypothetical protein [Polyangiaceae bacterium]MEB2325106.1 hypothetical protein [Sorangiineae bacterium]